MKRILAALLILCMTGCATERVMNMGTRYPATDPDKIKTYQTDKPTQKYEEIGRVSINKYNNLAMTRAGDEIYKMMREKAASIGGDAIIGISEDFASISGTVIKMKESQ